MFLVPIGEVRSINVVFDDEETGVEQMAKHQYDSDIRKYREQKGVPIFRQHQLYQAPHRNNFKTHGTMCQINQFTLKLAWGSTGHKVQGITIKKGTNVVVHGHNNIPHGMYYLMLSRCQELEQVYIEMPKKPGKSEDIELVIRANTHSLAENQKLVERSIVPFYKSNHFSVFMLNVGSLKNKITDLESDPYAQMSDHICVVETWIDPNVDHSFIIQGRYVFIIDSNTVGTVSVNSLVQGGW